jgi:Uma2 family endonuclease
LYMTLALERPTKTPPLELAPRRFTYAEFEQMSESGLFASEHVELLNGEIFVKGMQGLRHSYAVTTLTEKMIILFQSKASVAAQVPMILLSPPPDFVEPDLMLRKLPTSRYATQNTTSEDAILVIEVSDTTLERDQNAKLRAYARNKIPEYWILNLHTNQLEVNRNPDNEDYLETNKYKAGQTVAPLEFLQSRLEWWV